MNPQQLVAEYDEMRGVLHRHRQQLDDCNLGRYHDEYAQAIRGLDALIDGLATFR
ncbi:MAG: hypothetical protein K0U84_08785 [Actinomycetia bacterium]|nr:hypothetical protein [Actinomycetes bacterium]